MLKAKHDSHRELNTIKISTELTVAGGGLSGVCAAISAARNGVKVCLIQDRPVLGGNASSEIRLWILGATSHMGNNNRWAREGGIIDEILVENTYRNNQGNPVILDTIILEKVFNEPNITLLLNTALYEVVLKDNEREIKNVTAFCSQNSTKYIIDSSLFCDASGDGILSFLAGASFRMGAEKQSEFGEKFAPTEEYGELLGHSIYFYTKDTGLPVKYTAPSYAIDVTKEVPRFRSFNANENGCKLWWIEYGGRMDTVHDTEKIKWELWKVVYGAWNYIKNSGNFPSAENLTLEWVGMIPGKRESRRFEGDYMLKQSDLVEQNTYPDAVSYGGWSIDLHPADGVFSEKPGCNQWHTKGVYQIPYRSLYSKDIDNLFYAGRIISASHVAFASTRVIGTSAHGAQVVGEAAKICLDNHVLPRDINTQDYIEQLQTRLINNGQFIPGKRLEDDNDLVKTADVSASTELNFRGFGDQSFYRLLEQSMAQMIPVKKGNLSPVTFFANVLEDTTLKAELRISSKINNYTPDTIICKKNIKCIKGKQDITLDFDYKIEEEMFVYIIFQKNNSIELQSTHLRQSGVLSLFNGSNKAVSNFGKQMPTEDIGVDSFEFWCPQRRPKGFNLAFQSLNNLFKFSAEAIRNGYDRPYIQPNCWVAELNDKNPCIKISWKKPQKVSVINIYFDTDFDHPMESVLMGHPENVMPFCVRNYKITAGKGKAVIHKQKCNYKTINRIVLDTPVETDQLCFYFEHPSQNIPASVFSIRCYA